MAQVDAWATDSLMGMGWWILFGCVVCLMLGVLGWSGYQARRSSKTRFVGKGAGSPPCGGHHSHLSEWERTQLNAGSGRHT